MKTIKLLHLYPKDMNIYGDHGNVLVLIKRLEWHGYQPTIVEYNPGDIFPDGIDLIVGGGGQDSGQNTVHQDLLKIGGKLRQLAEEGVPMLMICGLYQLFGKFFETKGGVRLEGIGLLDIETYGRETRLIGNVTASSKEFGKIVGYENHSGQTFLGENVTPLAIVDSGNGNNLTDGHEGAIYKHVIGSYLHGALLPKNPIIADWLIERAAINKYGEFNPQKIDDSLAEQARIVAQSRPR